MPLAFYKNQDKPVPYYVSFSALFVPAPPRFMPFFLLPALGGQADVRHERDARASGGSPSWKNQQALN